MNKMDSEIASDVHKKIDCNHEEIKQCLIEEVHFLARIVV